MKLKTKKKLHKEKISVKAAFYRDQISKYEGMLNQQVPELKHQLALNKI